MELRKRFVEKFHVEQVILLPISAFLPYAEVRTGIFIFAKEKGDGMTRFYDLRKVEPENRKLLPEIYQRSEPVCVLNRTTLSEHQYILSTERISGRGKDRCKSFNLQREDLKKTYPDLRKSFRLYMKMNLVRSVCSHVRKGSRPEKL